MRTLASTIQELSLERKNSENRAERMLSGGLCRPNAYR
jgi:hypothetical protein